MAQVKAVHFITIVQVVKHVLNSIVAVYVLIVHKYVCVLNEIILEIHESANYEKSRDRLRKKLEKKGAPANEIYHPPGMNVGITVNNKMVRHCKERERR